jgi:rRNA maturation endonuclease Nob1
MVIILDASAFLSGAVASIKINPGEVLVTPEVVEEVRKGRPKKLLESLLAVGLEMRKPEDTNPAQRAAKETGDLELLSVGDISVISLAIENTGSTVMTDDFRIQNVLKYLQIDFMPAGELGNRKIEEVWRWTFRCRGCGRYFETNPGVDCPICGSLIKKVRKKIMSME